MKLYGASARNQLPRLVHAAAVMAVAAQCVGGAWTILWGASIWAGLIASSKLIAALERPQSLRATRLLTFAVNANNAISTAFQAAIIIAMWAQGDVVIKAFAVIIAFIGAAYVLLQYYSDLFRFRMLLAPYAAAFLYMAYDLGRGAKWQPAYFVICLAALVAMVNFFHLSRRLLDRSRTALRQARARAQHNEFAAESANAAKSTFLATMSHEIRTPLNGVLGMAQAMAADELSEIQRERLSVVHQSGEALLAILNDVLDLSKIEAGKLELETLEFDLSDVARGAHSAFTALANKKGLSFALDVEQARGRYLGDPTRLRQILYNLISNALKFTEQGEIRVTAVRMGEILEIAVRDTGVGISQEGLCKLFTKFDQLDSSTTRRFGGTGLGLSICRELAELMQGEIIVESELGRGSRFVVRLPLVHVGQERATARVEEARAELPPMALRVLAAEDNAVNQLVLKTLLHQLGVEPVVVGNGVQAVEAWNAGDWDVILMDIQMPVLDGLGATAQIRACERETGRRRTPIVALTANVMSHQVEQYRACGMDGFVSKPIEVADLFAALSRAIAAPTPETDGRDVAAVA
jgi:signal transduction histidine kinase/ActR/RegA family two-component response regulator